MRKIWLTVAGILCALGLAGCGMGKNADAAVGQTAFINPAAEAVTENEADGETTMAETDAMAVGDLEKEETEGSAEMTGQGNGAAFTADTKVWNVINDPAFEGYGRLLFPADKNINDDLTLGDVGNILTWYSYVNPDRTVAVVNELRERAASGEQIFYDRALSETQ